MLQLTVHYSLLTEIERWNRPNNILLYHYFTFKTIYVRELKNTFKFNNRKLVIINIIKLNQTKWINK